MNPELSAEAALTPPATSSDALKLPSILLSVVAIANFFTAFFMVMILAFQRSVGSFMGPLAETQPSAHGITQAIQQVHLMVLGVIALHVAAGAVQLVGSVRLRARRSFVICVVAAASALWPTSCLSYLSSAMGVWCLVSLLRPGIRATFR